MLLGVMSGHWSHYFFYFVSVYHVGAYLSKCFFENAYKIKTCVFSIIKSSCFRLNSNQRIYADVLVGSFPFRIRLVFSTIRSKTPHNNRNQYIKEAFTIYTKM